MPIHSTFRSSLFRLAATLLLAAQVVVLGLAPLAEGRVSIDFPTHIEEPGAPPHAGHHGSICSFCVLRHFSPLPTGRRSGALHVAVHQYIRPERPMALVVVGYERTDPARAPPSLPLQITV